jgi:hypothetical protein
MTLLAEEFCPVAESLLGQLYRSSPEGVAALIKTVPARTRAVLALYCYRRAHLQTLGLSVAESCSEHDLEALGGSMGKELLARARAGADPLEVQLKNKKGITLASGPLWNPTPTAGEGGSTLLRCGPISQRRLP